MANTIKKTIEIEFISKGLKTIQEELSSVSKFLPKDSQSAVAALESTLSRISASLGTDASSMTKEAFDIIKKDYLAAINQLNKLRNELVSKQMPALTAQREEIEKTTSALQNEKKELEAISLVNVGTGTSGQYTTTEAGIQAQKKNLAKGASDITGYKGAITDLATFEKTVNSIKDAYSKLSPEITASL